MLKNSLWKSGDTVLRVLEIKENHVLVIDCIKRTMPRWIEEAEMGIFEETTLQEMCLKTNVVLIDMDSLDVGSRRFGPMSRFSTS